jgi:sugar phosphate isomerase/epimerase
MDISISLGGWMPVFDRIAYSKECGWDACELPLGSFFNGENAIFNDIDNVTDEMLEEFFGNLRKEAERVGFRFGQTHSQFDGHIRESVYKGGYEEAVKKEIACVKATHYLGAKRMVAHPHILNTRKYEFNIPESFDQAVKFYDRLIPTLEEFDVYCCIENMWHCDSVFKHICPTILSRATEMAYVCDECGDHFRVCLDVGHCEVTQDDPVEAVHILGKRIACLHAHATDGMSDLHTFPFCAQSKPYSIEPMRTDWHEFMKALKEEGYDGALNFEIAAPGPLPVKMAGYRYLSKIGRYLSNVFEEYEV